MNRRYEQIVAILKSNPKYIAVDGSLLKAAVYEDAMTMNQELLKLLLSSENLKEMFFTSVDGALVFDKHQFAWLMQSREFLPDSYTAYTNKIGLAVSGEFISNSDKVVLDFPYKDAVLPGGQDKEDQKREEIMFHEVLAKDQISNLLAPKVFTKAVRFSGVGETDSTGQLVPGTIKVQEEPAYEFRDDDLIIKGNNLIALSSLLERYEGRVKLIYIDPPFNTGSDSFNYNDRFSRSTWLTFMSNRLRIAHRLLSSDGNIFIHIDINQSHYLKVLCDSIFGESNFVEEIIWAYGSPSGGRAATPKPVNIHDYILHYAKTYEQRKQNRVYVPYSEKYIHDWFKFTDEDGRVYQRRQRGKDEDGNAIWVRQYLDESKGVPLSTVWTDIQQVYADPRAYKSGNKADVEVIKEFSGGQKPEALIKRIIDMSTNEGDLVLDFHLGTGTTAATAHKMRRKYIGVEQMDSQIELILPRLQKVICGETAGISKSQNWNGGGSFVYCELMEDGARRIREIETATDQTIDQLKASIYQDERVVPYLTTDELKAADEGFEALSLEDKKRVLIALIDKNKIYVNASSMDDEEYQISEEDKAVTKSFYEGGRA